MSNDERPQLRPTQVKSSVHLGVILRAARVAAGLELGDVARRTGKAPQTISARESGRRALSVTDALIQLEVCGYGLAVVPLPFQRDQLVGADAV